MRRLGLLLLYLACTPGSRLDRVTAEQGSSPATSCPATSSTPRLAAPPELALAPIFSVMAGGVDPAPTSAPGDVAPVLAASTVRRVEVPPPGVITAAHDDVIATLAATDDGGAAVSLDRRGGMRLWPSLDGKREPVVVRSEAAAQQVAITRDGDDLVIAAAGPLGQLELIRTSGLGEPVSHRWVDLERRLVGLYATPGRFVGLLDDQTVAAVDVRGERVERLATHPGERIVAMASRRGALLAFVNAEGSTRARWIATGEALAWGSESPALGIDPEHAALAPDGRRVAALTRDHKGIVIVELASGRVLERPVDADFVDPKRQPLGFLDDRALMVQSADGTSGWWRHRDLETTESLFSAADVIATDRCVVSAVGSSLMLDTPDGRRHLGFRVMTIASARPHGNGWTVTDGARALRLDDQLRARRRYLPRDGALEAERSLVVLDGRHAIVATADGISLIDLEHPADGKLLVSMFGTVSYEPATHLLAIAGDPGLWLGHYNARTHDIDQQLDVLGEARAIVLLDPELSGGSVARVLAPHDLNVMITEIRKVDFAAAKLEVARTYERPLPEEDGVFHGDLAALAGLAAPARHRTSPDGSLVAVVGDGRVTLRDRDGAARWSVARPGVTDVAWSALGELIAFGSGMARVDVGTGALIERRCGWDFGLWDEASFETSARLCEAP